MIARLVLPLLFGIVLFECAHALTELLRLLGAAPLARLLAIADVYGAGLLLLVEGRR